MDTSSWTPKHKDDCVAYGCHKSAKMHKQFIHEEMADFIKRILGGAALQHSQGPT